MKFGDYEIRQLETPNRYELVLWNGNCCFVIAFLGFDLKNRCLKFESVSNRYLNYRCDGLEQWILAWEQLKLVELDYGSEAKYIAQ